MKWLELKSTGDGLFLVSVYFYQKHLAKAEIDKKSPIRLSTLAVSANEIRDKWTYEVYMRSYVWHS